MTTMDNVTVEDIRVLMVQFVGPDHSQNEVKNSKVISNRDGEMQTPNLGSNWLLQVNLSGGGNHLPGEVLHQFRVENGRFTDLESFHYKLLGKESETYSVTPLEKGVDEKYLQLKLLESRPVFSHPLILQISPIGQSSTSHSSSYLIQLNRQSISGEHTDNKTPAIGIKKKELEVTVAENARAFSELVRLELINNEEGAERRKKVTYELVGRNETPANVFKIHPITGVLSIQKSEELNLEKLGGQDVISLQVHLLDQEGNVVDEAQIRVRIGKGSSPSTATNSPSSSEAPGLLKFEQPIYAFAVGPGVHALGRIQVAQPSPSVRYSISEGGASYFSIDGQSGLLTYDGPLEKNTRNYTLKAIAVNRETGQLDTTSIQTLVAGIGSSSPQLSKSVEVAEIAEGEPTDTPLHTIAAVDFDSDARLQYKITGAKCFTVLGQPMNVCKELFRFGNGGLRNGSIFLTKKLVDSNAADGVIERKVLALNSAQLNISVTDTNHPLEPPSQGLLLLRVTRSNVSISSQADDPGAGSNTFEDFPAEWGGKIDVSDTLPINSYLYTVLLSPLVAAAGNASRAKYSLIRGQKFFAVDAESGVLSSVASLKGVGRQNATVAAKDASSGQVIDTITLIIDVKNSENSSPEFKQQYYEFSAFTNNTETVEIGQVDAEDKENDRIKYSIVFRDDEPIWEEGDRPITISSKGQIIANAKKNYLLTNAHEYSFLVKATDARGGSALVPVSVKLMQPTNSLTPTLSPAPTSILLMENSPIGTFVADLSAGNANKFELLSPTPANTTSARLLSSLVVDQQTGVVRTFAPLSRMKDGLYEVDLVAHNGEQSTTARLSIHLIPTSKCMPKFGGEQQLVFNAMIPANAGTEIGRMEAQIMSGCELIYSIENEDKPFGVRIDPQTGALSIRAGETEGSLSQLDASAERFPLTILAKSGHLFSRLGIEIRLHSNPNSPQLTKPLFLQSRLQVEVLENIPPNGTLGRVKAYSSARNLPVFYHLMENYGMFDIESRSGRIFTTKGLDHETGGRKFGLKVRASYAGTEDQTGSEQGENLAEVVVYVLDM